MKKEIPYIDCWLSMAELISGISLNYRRFPRVRVSKHYDCNKGLEFRSIETKGQIWTKYEPNMAVGLREETLLIKRSYMKS